MLPIQRIVRALFFCGLFFGVGFSGAEDANTAPVVLTTHNLYPYGSYAAGYPEKVVADHTFNGIAVDVVRCAFRAMEAPLEIQVYPWKRAQFQVQHDRAAGFFAASHTESRDRYAVMSDTIAEQNWNWYLLKDNLLDPRDASFKQEAGVAGFLGANMLAWMEENGYQVKARALDTQGLLKVLLMGRVDAVMANNYVMEALLEKYAMHDEVKVVTEKEKPLAVYFSHTFVKNNPGFVEQFNSFLPECRVRESQ